MNTTTDNPQIIVLFEDNDILVINKPSGITVNKADTTRHEVTVQDWAEEKMGLNGSKVSEVSQVSKGSEKAFGTSDTLGTFDTFSTIDTFYQRGGVVHRLDKETSGVLLLAKNPESFSELQRQFKERIVKKTYLALAHGKVAPAEGEIRVPVGRLPWNRKQFGVVAGGREAVTKYKVLSSNYYPAVKEELSLVELYPETGRTHQIRVHLKYLGFPIFADFLYAGRKIQREDRKVLSRVFLHAAKLTFLHPTTKKEMTVESPLPQELKKIIEVSNVS